jgi:hypothetical protein
MKRKFNNGGGGAGGSTIFDLNNQPINQQMNQYTNPPMNPPMNPYTNIPMNQPINQPINPYTTPFTNGYNIKRKIYQQQEPYQHQEPQNYYNSFDSDDSEYDLDDSDSDYSPINPSNQTKRNVALQNELQSEIKKKNIPMEPIDLDNYDDIPQLQLTNKGIIIKESNSCYKSAVLQCFIQDDIFLMFLFRPNADKELKHIFGKMLRSIDKNEDVTEYVSELDKLSGWKEKGTQQDAVEYFMCIIELFKKKGIHYHHIDIILPNSVRDKTNVDTPRIVEIFERNKEEKSIIDENNFPYYIDNNNKRYPLMSYIIYSGTGEEGHYMFVKGYLGVPYVYNGNEVSMHASKIFEVRLAIYFDDTQSQAQSQSRAQFGQRRSRKRSRKRSSKRSHKKIKLQQKRKSRRRKSRRKIVKRKSKKK